MNYTMPVYQEPDFTVESLKRAPNVSFAMVTRDGVAPDHYHATSIFPEYFKINGQWLLAEESRMDCCVTLKNGKLEVVEARRLKVDDQVILGRSETGEEGIYIHASGFQAEEENPGCFAFRTGRSRETAFSQDYDSLYNLLIHEREYGNIVWVMGPACVFDSDSRAAMSYLIENGFAHGILAGNALATHDLEAAYFGTALGQDIYSQRSHHNGHYNHLDVLNLARRSGSIKAFLSEYNINNGVINSCVNYGIPFVLTGSIRDDGPMPEVIADVYEGQDKMRELVRKATTIICLATQLHTIATGNMTPSYRIVNGVVRPLFIYSVDVTEFALNKLSDRGSLTSVGIVTNVQDFIVTVTRGVQRKMNFRV